MDKPQFNIGDEVLYVFIDSFHFEEEVCPDCAGHEYHEVTLGCGDTYKIACDLCTPNGYDKLPTGVVRTRKPTPKIKKVTVTGVSLHDGIFYYETTDSSGYERCILYPTTGKGAEDAMEKQSQMIRDMEERDPTPYHERGKSLAWNMSYHRKQIRECESKIKYSTDCLDALKQLKKKGNIK